MSLKYDGAQLHPGRYASRLIAFTSILAPNLKPKLIMSFWRTIYSSLTVFLLKDDDTAFLNYGYSSIESGKVSLELEPADEPDRYSIQLYHRVASACPIAGKKVLEIGCGRGGGASFIARYLEPEFVTGLDLSNRAVEYCKRRHRLPNLNFQTGSAENCPLHPVPTTSS